MNKLYCIILLFIFVSCGRTQQNTSPETAKLEVLFFLSPECPLSEKYSKTINEIYSDYKNRDVDFLLVFPGNLYSSSEVTDFIDSFRLTPPFIVDTNNVLVQQLNASITPEVFLLDSSKNILYSGAIDDWAIELTKTRINVTNNYLRNALDDALNHQDIKTKKTEAIGCIIE